MPSSREQVDASSPWNEWLRSEIPQLFVKAFESFKEEHMRRVSESKAYSEAPELEEVKGDTQEENGTAISDAVPEIEIDETKTKTAAVTAAVSSSSSSPDKEGEVQITGDKESPSKKKRKRNREKKERKSHAKARDIVTLDDDEPQHQQLRSEKEDPKLVEMYRAVSEYLRFVPLSGEIASFFRPVAGEIVKLLRKTKFLPTQVSTAERIRICSLVSV